MAATSGLRRVVIVASLGVLAGMAAPAAVAEERDRPNLTGRLRPADPKAASLLQTGLARSATFRRLAEVIEHSDLLVYVETRPLPVPAQLQFVVAASGCRHVRVSVRVPGRDPDLVAWTAHELWHAVEIAGAADVVDQASLVRFYERTGQVSRRNSTAETGKAQEIWAQVLKEMLYRR